MAKAITPTRSHSTNSANLSIFGIWLLMKLVGASSCLLCQRMSGVDLWTCWSWIEEKEVWSIVGQIHNTSSYNTPPGNQILAILWLPCLTRPILKTALTSPFFYQPTVAVKVQIPFCRLWCLYQIYFAAMSGRVAIVIRWGHLDQSATQEAFLSLRTLSLKQKKA